MHTYNLLYSYSGQAKKGQGSFLSEHILWLMVSGVMEVVTAQGLDVFRQGEVCLAQKNQLFKAIKKPDGLRPFKGIGIFLDQNLLKQYSLEHGIKVTCAYAGAANIRIPVDRFMRGYFDSLLPYFDQPDQLTETLAHAKTTEALALLLRDHSLKDFLFDFREPGKIDLEAYMNRHFTYPISLAQFAQLTGRSLSTFKRDFAKIFNTPPERWLRQQRLQRAQRLLVEQRQRPSDVYWAVGFENLSHFSACYKTYFGYSPHQSSRQVTSQ